MASGLASGGRGATWLLLLPVIIVVYYATEQLFPSHGRDVSFNETLAFGAVVIGCFALWYFVIGRIPNWITVHNVVREANKPDGVFGVDVFSRPHRAAKYTMRFAGAVPNVLCVSASGLQLWAGRGDAARPVQTWSWTKIQSVGTQGATNSSLIAVAIQGNTVPFMMSVLENRVLSTMRVRGRARSRLVARIEALREPAAAKPQVL
jgi:hypothetical protein